MPPFRYRTILGVILISTFYFITPPVVGNEEVVYNTNNICMLKNETGACIQGFGPSFSIVSDKIVYLSTEIGKLGPESGGSPPAIWIVNSDGSNNTLIYVHDKLSPDFTRPNFSPDESKILLSLTYVNKSEIVIGVLVRNGSEWDRNSTFKTIYKHPSSWGFLE